MQSPFWHSRRVRLALATALVLAAPLLWFWQHKPQAPDTAFLLIEGQRKSTAQWQGQVLLVNFWATSCAPCVAEMPMLAQTHDRYHARGFDTVAVAMAHDPPDYVVHFAHSRKLPFAVAIDADGAAAKAWGHVQRTPTTFVLDRSGRIVQRYIGAPDAQQLHALIERLLNEKAG